VLSVSAVEFCPKKATHRRNAEYAEEAQSFFSVNLELDARL
jgi:hypothetical protein